MSISIDHFCIGFQAKSLMAQFCVFKRHLTTNVFFLIDQRYPSIVSFYPEIVTAQVITR